MEIQHDTLLRTSHPPEWTIARLLQGLLNRIIPDEDILDGLQNLLYDCQELTGMRRLGLNCSLSPWKGK